MTDLSAELHALREDVAWPATPDLAGSVAARLPAATARSQAQPRARRWRPRRRRLRLVLATALLLALAIAAVPPARSAVAELLGLEGGEQIRRVPELPPAPRRANPSQAPGARTTLARARAAVGFPVRVPGALGPPDAVRLWDGLPGGVVILTYGDGAALWAFRGSAAQYAQKFVTGATTLRRVRVGRAPALWIIGGPVEFLAVGRDGIPRQATAAIVDAHVLVWHQGGVAYRLETRDGLRRALAVAASLHG